MNDITARLRARQMQQTQRSPGDRTTRVVVVDDPLCQLAADEIDRLRRELADMTVERDILRRDNANMRASVHTCGPTCAMAGCVNARLRAALREAVPELEYMAGGMTHAAWKTEQAKKTLAIVKAALGEQ